MHDEAVGVELHERQRPQASVRGGGVLAGEHRLEQRERGAAGERGGVERPPGRLVETVEVEAGELLSDGPGGDRLERDARPVAQRPGRELEAQRVAAAEGVDAARRAVVDPVAAQQRDGVLVRQVADREQGQQRAVRAPVGGRRVAPGQHHAHVGGERGDERARDPVVDGQEELVRVDEQDHALAAGAERGGRLLDRRGAEGGEEGLPGGVDGVRIDQHGLGPRLARIGLEGMQQRRLADAAEAVDMGHDRAAVLEQLAEPRPLALTADDGARSFLQQGSERRGHRPGNVRVARWAVTGASTTLARAVVRNRRKGVASLLWAGRCSTSSSCLKLPILAACLIIWWAVRQEVEPEDDSGGGGGRRRPHPPPRLPRAPRRGPHREAAPPSPPRTRAVVGRVREPLG